MTRRRVAIAVGLPDGLILPFFASVESGHLPGFAVGISPRKGGGHYREPAYGCRSPHALFRSAAGGIGGDIVVSLSGAPGGLAKVYQAVATVFAIHLDADLQETLENLQVGGAVQRKAHGAEHTTT